MLLLQITFQESFQCMYFHQLVDFGAAGKWEGEPVESQGKQESQQNKNMQVEVALQQLDANEQERASCHRPLHC